VRLDIPLGPGKLKVRFSSELALVPGLGAHQLRLPLEVDSESLDENRLVILGGTLWLGGNAPSYLAAWTTEDQVALRTFPITHHLVASLSDDQLVSIEQHRGAHELSLAIDVRVSMPGIQDAWPTATDQGSVRIAASRWLKQLEGVGAAAAFTIVVPSPLVDGDRARMGAHLREARNAINDGRYGGAVASARMALEIAREREPLPGEPSIRAKPARSLSPAERWAALNHAVFGLASVAHHEDEVTADAVWSRADAVAGVAATAALIARQD
jgi:hypothetical protein